MNNTLLMLMLTSLLSSPAFADIVDQSVAEQDDPSQLKSISQLSSLKNISKSTAEQAPYVHDLKMPIKCEHYLLNHKHCRSWIYNSPLMRVRHKMSV